MLLVFRSDWWPAWATANWPFSQVFVELNELTIDKNQEMQWKETARWIKFEEDVEEETDRWGKPHVASLSFRSLLELRRTISHGIYGKREKPSALVTGFVPTELPVCLQGRCCWTWTRRPCLVLPTRWWSRWSFLTRSKLRTEPTSWEPCCLNTGDRKCLTAANILDASHSFTADSFEPVNTNGSVKYQPQNMVTK